jgi:hypothetical protein
MATDFGRETHCITSRKTGRFATGTSLVAQRCVHRLITPRGQLRGGEAEKNFGLDLAGLVGAATSPELEAAMGPRIQNELLKDEQVFSVNVDVVTATVAGQVSWTFTILVQTASGPFRLVLNVEDVTINVLLEDVTS